MFLSLMWEIPSSFTVKIGGNYYTDCDPILRIKGEPIFRLKRRDDGLLGIDFDLYDSKGQKVATIRNGHIVQGDASAYTLKKEKHRYWILDKTGAVICDVRQVTKAEPGCEIEVSVDLYSKNGFHYKAAPDRTEIGGPSGMVITGCRFNGGTAIEIT
jgi:hypothetical protein